MNYKTEFLSCKHATRRAARAALPSHFRLPVYPRRWQAAPQALGTAFLFPRGSARSADLFCRGNLAHTGGGNRVCSDTFKQAKELCSPRVLCGKCIRFQGGIEAGPEYRDQVLPPVTFPDALGGGTQPGYPSNACGAPSPGAQSTRTPQTPPARRAPASRPQHRAPAPRGLPRPFPPPRTCRPRPSLRRPRRDRTAAPSSPRHGQSDRNAPAPGEEGSGGGSRPARPHLCAHRLPSPDATVPPPAGRASCSEEAQHLSGLPPTPGPLRPPALRTAEGNKLRPLPHAGEARDVNRPEAGTGARCLRPPAPAPAPPCPGAHRRETWRLLPSSPSSPGALRAGTAGGRRLRPPLSALFVAVKA